MLGFGSGLDLVHKSHQRVGGVVSLLVLVNNILGRARAHITQQHDVDY